MACFWNTAIVSFSAVYCSSVLLGDLGYVKIEFSISHKFLMVDIRKLCDE